jgi:hypothetical protein
MYDLLFLKMISGLSFGKWGTEIIPRKGATHGGFLLPHPSSAPYPRGHEAAQARRVGDGRQNQGCQGRVHRLAVGGEELDVGSILPPQCGETGAPHTGPGPGLTDPGPGRPGLTGKRTSKEERSGAGVRPAPSREETGGVGPGDLG